MKLNSTYQSFLFVSILMFLSSCFKEEKPLPKPPTGIAQVVEIPLTSKYDKQFYFDLFTNQIVKSHNNEIWDLAFDAHDNGYHIYLNGSKLMQAWNTGSKDFDGINSYTNAKWAWDYPDGDLAKNAIGEWGSFNNGNVVSKNEVYVIDRGVNKNEVNLGKRKIVFESLQNGTYKIKYAKMNGEDSRTLEIPKDNRFNRVYFSFNNDGEIVQVEPEKNTYDLIFSRYTHIFLEFDTLPYLVTGTILNPSGVTAAKDSIQKFEEVTIANINNLTFSNAPDAIGYDWKSFDINQEKYEIIAGKYYVVKDQEGHYYKLRFLDFFSSTGERGYPKFEYEAL